MDGHRRAHAVAAEEEEGGGGAAGAAPEGDDEGPEIRRGPRVGSSPPHGGGARYKRGGRTPEEGGGATDPLGPRDRWRRLGERRGKWMPRPERPEGVGGSSLFGSRWTGLSLSIDSDAPPVRSERLPTGLLAGPARAG